MASNQPLKILPTVAWSSVQGEGGRWGWGWWEAGGKAEAGGEGGVFPLSDLEESWTIYREEVLLES